MSDPHICIVSVGTALPGPAITNAKLAERFGMDRVWEQWVDAFIDTRVRHLATDLDSGKVTCSLADLAESAGRRALESAGLGPGDIDVMVMGTATPDMLMPTTLNMVADRLGVNGVPTYQLQSGCSGAVQALELASRLLQGGTHRTALVFGGDVGAKHYDLRIDLKSLTPTELVNVVLFGDGAGAAVLTADPSPEPGTVLLRTARTRLVGLGRAPGQVIEWFGLADRDSKRTAGGEDYKMIEQSVPTMAAEILRELLDELSWRDDELDYVLPPQLSGRMTARIVERLAVPDAREVSCVRETGNNGNALVFFQLERALPLLEPGDRALGIAVESSKWIKSGFALEKA
jgi:3-oxoacyl-[acyl-carrier-protein] synthase III